MTLTSLIVFGQDHTNTEPRIASWGRCNWIKWRDRWVELDHRHGRSDYRCCGVEKAWETWRAKRKWRLLI